MQEPTLTTRTTGRLALALMLSMALGATAHAAVSQGRPASHRSLAHCLCEAARQLAGIHIAASPSDHPRCAQARQDSTRHQGNTPQRPSLDLAQPTLLDLPPPTHA